MSSTNVKKAISKLYKAVDNSTDTTNNGLANAMLTVCRHIESQQDTVEGIVFACARLVELHDEPTMAKDVLLDSISSHGKSIHNLNECARYDLDFLRGEIEELPKGK